MDKEKKLNPILEGFYLKSKQEKWDILYDKESDALYWTKKPLPLLSRLVKVAKEIFFFLDKKGDINGLMVQPFQNNFLMHNEEVADVKKLFTYREDKFMFSIPSKEKKEGGHLISTLLVTIQKDIYKDAAETKHSVEEIEKFLASSVK